jgi:hypothetical protein
MKYLFRKSYVDVIGEIWMPAGTCAMRYPLSAHDIENIRDDDGAITRESIEQWLTSNSGDFQHVADFSASIEVGENTLDFAWKNEDSEFTYNDCMYPAEC